MPTASTTNPSQPAGQFAAQSDIEDQFGKINVATWSQLDNTITSGNLPVADENRILRALQWADAKIISIFYTQGNYTTPIVPQGADVIRFTRWSAILAGAWLYLSRGLRDEDPQGHHLKKMQSETIEEMTQSRTKEKLNAAPRWPTATSPTGYSPKQ